MAYTAEVLNLINKRVDELNGQLAKHKGTEHEYALSAGLYELLRLGIQVKQIADKERNALIERSWRDSPDRMGGQFTADEIARDRDNRW